MQARRLWILGLVILLAALSRLLPHPPNFSPVLAMALFGGMAFRDWRLAAAVPLAAMLVSDLILGLHSQLLTVYGALLVVVLMGRGLRGRLQLLPVVGMTLGGSLWFFLITNFGVWLADGLYPLTTAGLLACYTAALPFLQNSVLGNFFYVAILFGGYALLIARLQWMGEGDTATA